MNIEKNEINLGSKNMAAKKLNNLGTEDFYYELRAELGAPLQFS